MGASTTVRKRSAAVAGVGTWFMASHFLELGWCVLRQGHFGPGRYGLDHGLLGWLRQFLPRQTSRAVREVKQSTDFGLMSKSRLSKVKTAKRKLYQTLSSHIFDLCRGRSGLPLFCEAIVGCLNGGVKIGLTAQAQNHRIPRLDIGTVPMLTITHFRNRVLGGA